MNTPIDGEAVLHIDSEPHGSVKKGEIA
jgi:hypothetical protein